MFQKVMKMFVPAKDSDFQWSHEIHLDKNNKT